METPQHIGIILDGNRRYAKARNLKPWQGHTEGAKKLDSLFKWARELGIKELTLYTFSIENFKRPKDEFEHLMDIFRTEFERIKQDKSVKENDLKINFIGRIDLFPEDITKKLKELMEMTKDHKTYTVNFAMAYTGRAEIVDATKKIAKKVKEGKLNIEDINQETFRENLYLQSYPDLIIRTSGEQRISGFLIWQGAYSEFYFCPKMWPEFEKEDLQNALETFQNRSRRFGK